MSRHNYEITFSDKKRVDVINYLWGKSNVQRFCYFQIKKEQENEEQNSFIYVNLATKSRSSTFDKTDLFLNVEPAKNVVYNLTKKYGREKGYQYFDKRGEETNLKTLKSFFMYEILINGTEPTSLIKDSFFGQRRSPVI